MLRGKRMQKGSSHGSASETIARLIRWLQSTPVLIGLFSLSLDRGYVGCILAIPEHSENAVPHSARISVASAFLKSHRSGDRPAINTRHRALDLATLTSLPLNVAPLALHDV